MYSYAQPGAMVKKRMRLARTNTVTTVDLDAVWTYDNEGTMTSVAYPMGPAYNCEYDLAGRLNKMKLGETEHVNNVQYGAAGQLLQVCRCTMATQGFSETEYRSYNNRLQLTRVKMVGVLGNPLTTTMDTEYRYSATQNDGKLTQMKNWISGEEVTYQYDSLQRLVSAVTTGPKWGLSFSYDGFGNRTAQTVTKGSAPVVNLSYDVATNRILTAGFGYDANGNVTALPGGRGQSYDVENRLVSASGQRYGYDHNNKRVVLKVGYAEEEIWFWAGNQRLGRYRMSIDYSTEYLNVTALDHMWYFGGRKLIPQDRLGSNLKGTKYFPYGEEPTVTAQDRDKFATYYRDGATNLDYADQRYHASTLGRFLTPDPYVSKRSRMTPNAWNQYSYVEGDPINFGDPRGLCVVESEGGLSEGAECLEEVPIHDNSPAGGSAHEGGGGISTAGQATRRFIRVKNPSKSGPQQRRINQVARWIKETIDPDCAKWLGDVGAHIGQLLGNGTDAGTFIGRGEFDNRYVSAFTGSNPNQTDLPEGFAITINDTGAFFYGSFWDSGLMRPLSAGGFTGGTSQAQFFTVLHNVARIGAFRGST